MSAQTTAEGAGEESHPWGFEREAEKPGWQDVSVTVERIGRKVFTADGMLDALLGKVRAMLNTRGPEDYEKNERDLQSLIFEAVKLGAQNGGYREAPKYPPKRDGSLKAVIIACTATLSIRVRARRVETIQRLGGNPSGVHRMETSDAAVDGSEREAPGSAGESPPVTHAHNERTSSPDENTVAHPGANQNVNKFHFSQSAIAIIALIFSSIALGAVFMAVLLYALIGSQLIDAKIVAGASQAETTAKEARTTAKMTEDKLAELRDALNAKGMNIPKLDGHN